MKRFQGTSFLALTLGLALGAAGCSSDSGSKNTSTPSHDSGTPSGDSGSHADARPVLGPYPDGPYGNTVGATLTNLKLQGYLNADGVGLSSQEPWLDAYSLEDVRATGASYAFVHVSEFF